MGVTVLATYEPVGMILQVLHQLLVADIPEVQTGRANLESFESLVGGMKSLTLTLLKNICRQKRFSS